MTRPNGTGFLIDMYTYSNQRFNKLNTPKRKEVIHPHLLVGVPCYDLTPIINPTLVAFFPYGLEMQFQVLPTLIV